MGNSPSLRKSFEVTLSDRAAVESKEGGTWKEINICLLCQQNSYESALGKPIGVVKDAITEFLKEVYATSDATNFNWTTWDTEDADIVLSAFPDLRNANTAPVFDVIVELHCEISCSSCDSAPPADDYRVMCRLLKQQGLLVVPRNYDEINHIARIHPEYLCNDPTRPGSEKVAEMMPIFSVGPDEEDTTDRRNLQSFEGGLTVFQKTL